MQTLVQSKHKVMALYSGGEKHLGIPWQRLGERQGSLHGRLNKYFREKSKKTKRREDKPCKAQGMTCGRNSWRLGKWQQNGLAPCWFFHRWSVWSKIQGREPLVWPNTAVLINCAFPQLFTCCSSIAMIAQLDGSSISVLKSCVAF